MKRGLCLSILVLFLVPVSGLSTENVGDLFSLGASARGLGIGGAFCALVDDEASAYYNPAALAWYKGVGATSLFARQFGGVPHGAIVMAAPYIGAAIFALDSGFIPIGDEGFHYASQGFVASAGFPIGPVAIGIRWRLFRVSSPFDGSGWTIDPSLLVVTPAVRVGLVYEGAVSMPVAYANGEEDAWDRSLRLSVATTLSPAAGILWSPAFEIGGLFSSSTEWLGGLEVWIAGIGARVGYDGAGPTFGLSVQLESLQIDWAYAARTDLGDSHRVSFTYRF